MYTKEFLMEKTFEELKVIVRNADMRVTKHEMDMIEAVMTIKKTKLPAPKAVGAHRFVDTDLIAKGKMTEEEAQAIVDEKTRETQIRYADAMIEMREVPEPKIEEEIAPDEKVVAIFCLFCDSKGVKHKKVCTREQVAA